MIQADNAAIKIKRLKRESQDLLNKIENIVRKIIPDYHFLDFSVSTFWTCNKSPVGMCVFILDNVGRRTICRYCEEPVERK